MKDIQHFRQSSWGIRVKAASRLSFTLIDLNGETGRRNGMASLSLENPFFEAKIYKSNKLSISWEDSNFLYDETIKSYVRDIQNIYNSDSVNIEIVTSIPPHCGFGSKTTTLMAIGKAYSDLYELGISTNELAIIANRGGTSGASVNLIDRGGFLIDGGHKNPDDFGLNPQNYLLPSRYAKTESIPPVILNASFPNWPIIIVLCNGDKVDGKSELSWFNSTMPIPIMECQKTAHLVFLNLATSILERDYKSFCAAINRITFDTYFKRKQIENQPGNVQRIISICSELDFIDAVGMSSMGPACYIFTTNPKLTLEWLENIKKQGEISDYWITFGVNSPCTINKIYK